MVGLIEEAAPEDKYCLEQYCANQGKLRFIGSCVTRSLQQSHLTTPSPIFCC
jgi:hypothetical protein